MSHRILIAIALFVFCGGRQAFGHGDPIIVTASNGALTTNGNIFTSEFEPLGGLRLTNVPGFEFLGFQFGDEARFEIVDHLWYWNETTELTPADEELEFIVESNASPFPQVKVSHNPDHVPGENQFVPGFLLETIDGQSPEHQHLLSYLFEESNIPDGAYGIMLRVQSEGYLPTDPFLIAFNDDIGGLAFLDGVAAISEAAFFEPGTGIPGDFNADQLVNATDIDLLFAHRGSDEPEIYDLVPDSTIDDLDAAYWVEEIVGTIKSGRGTLLGIACEKPLARNVAEARRVLQLVNSVK
ncbi:MAG: hypothetical protein SGJ19_14375, partial [Planctomycetia bacterium]|nr:hypothetical protein [Planctomycetia bacterium]